jgi:uroporphyrinogen decarboxylase
MEEAPDLLKHGLSTIAESLARFSQACLEAGLDGIYFAANGCSYDQMTEAQYREFVMPHDLQVLEAVEEGTFNVVHIHGTSNLMFQLLSDYPAHALCWSSRLTEPSLAQARALGDWPLLGGINEDPSAILSKSPTEMRAEVEDAIAQVEGHKLILGPGCAVPRETPPELLEAALDAVRRQ